MLKKLLIAAVILLIIGVTGALLTAKSYISNQNENEKQTRHFQSAQIQSIEIVNPAGTVKLVETSGDDIIVEAYSSKTSRPVKMKTNGELLSIINEADHKITLGVNFKKSSENINVYLPKKQYKRIAVSNEVGEVIIHQINAFTIEAKSDVGNVDINNVTSKSINASSGLGNISINDYSGKLQVENEMGNINISTNAVLQPIIAQNELGKINLKINQDPKNLFISADTEIGSPQIFGKKTGSYKSGDGSITVELSTEAGDIRVDN